MGKVNIIGNRNTNEFVITPGGLRPEENVYQIAGEHHLKIEENTIFEVKTETDNIVKELGKIDFRALSDSLNRSLLRKSDESLMEEDVLGIPISNRWIVYSGWLNEGNEPITYFSTKWVVPPHPATDSGQLIYLFNGIENSALSVILQPVLQWGPSPAGGGNFWAITSWFVGAPGSGIAVHKELARVNPGDVLEAFMSLVKIENGRYTYRSAFRNFPQCDLIVEGIEELKWANETLECYAFSSFSDYPDTNFTAMEDIEIRVGDRQANLQWTVNNDVTDNGQHCDIISSASPNGSVKLFYRNDFMI